MEKTQITTRKRYNVVASPEIVEFEKHIAQIFGDKNYECTHFDNGDMMFTLRGYTGEIYVKAKSGKLVVKLSHRDYIQTKDCVVMDKRFYSAKSFKDLEMDLAIELIELRDKVKKGEEAKAKLVKDKPAKTQTTEKKEHGKNALGHIKNTMADMLDKLFLQGVTEEELQAAGFAPARYRSHFRHLNTAKVALVEVRFENGKYTAKMIG